MIRRSVRLQRSILDHLLAPTTNRDEAGQDGWDSRRTTDAPSLQSIREAVARDVEMLMTTRQCHLVWPASLDALSGSIVNYGIPDFSSANLATRQAQEEFRRSIESTIKRFEPRFHHVSVSIVDLGKSLDRRLRFSIEAVLHVDAEPILLDSVLDPVTRSFAVRSAVDA